MQITQHLLSLDNKGYKTAELQYWLATIPLWSVQTIFDNINLCATGLIQSLSTTTTDDEYRFDAWGTWKESKCWKGNALLIHNAWIRDINLLYPSITQHMLGYETEGLQCCIATIPLWSVQTVFWKHQSPCWFRAWVQLPLTITVDLTLKALGNDLDVGIGGRALSLRIVYVNSFFAVFLIFLQLVLTVYQIGPQPNASSRKVDHLPSDLSMNTRFVGHPLPQ